MKALIVVFDIFIIYAILMTGSRGTWIALILSVGLFPLLAPNIPLKKRFKYFLGGATAIFAIIFGLVNNYFGHSGQLIIDRLTEHNSVAEASGGRLSYIWPVYFESFLQKPIFGWGITFDEYIGLSAHNDFLWILAGTGLMGISLLLLFHFFILKNILENKDPNLRLQSLVLFVFLISAGLTHNTVTLKSYSLAIGALCFLAKLTNKENEASSALEISTD